MWVNKKTDRDTQGSSSTLASFKISLGDDLYVDVSQVKKEKNRYKGNT